MIQVINESNEKDFQQLLESGEIVYEQLMNESENEYMQLIDTLNEDENSVKVNRFNKFK